MYWKKIIITYSASESSNNWKLLAQKRKCVTSQYYLWSNCSISTHNILNQISHRENSSRLPLQSKAYQWELLITLPSLIIQTLKKKNINNFSHQYFSCNCNLIIGNSQKSIYILQWEYLIIARAKQCIGSDTWCNTCNHTTAIERLLNRTHLQLRKPPKNLAIAVCSSQQPHP